MATSGLVRWDQLPILVLTKVLNYLQLMDRLVAGKVCQSWLKALDSPSLWRTVSIHFDRDVFVLNELLIEIANRYGHYTTKLELDWSNPQIHYIFQRDLGVSFISTLNQNKVQIEELTLKEFGFHYRWTFRHRMNVVLNQFLRCQNNLRLFRMINEHVRPNDVLRLVNVIAQSCGHVLRKVDLGNALKKVQPVHSIPRLIESISCMSVLTDLSINYNVLSDAVLQTMASATNGLINFNIIVSDTMSWNDPLSEKAWQQLKNSCPNLQVFLKIENFCHFEELVPILTPNIPLRRFHLYSGRNWDQRIIRDLRSSISLLINHYSSTLVDLIINVKNNREMLDDLILELIDKCVKLEDLKFNGILRDFEIIREIFEYFKAKNVTKFKTFNLNPRSINSRNREIVREIMIDHKEYFNRDDLNYSIGENAGQTVLYYYL
ncbi:hypothetical protein LSTR_LSTR004711 [Laodelphax striatellus]|uniref:F-box domain-containing protein n=1 Tax=Laodelphax striatellus TaxID=195883 RepID=A0A482WU55_LAOST|nr:hypothetical protein LSTR_LSTR004711 [Laodelphax striatellus]